MRWFSLMEPCPRASLRLGGGFEGGFVEVDDLILPLGCLERADKPELQGAVGFIIVGVHAGKTFCDASKGLSLGFWNAIGGVVLWFGAAEELLALAFSCSVLVADLLGLRLTKRQPSISPSASRSCKSNTEPFKFGLVLSPLIVELLSPHSSVSSVS